MNETKKKEWKEKTEPKQYGVNEAHQVNCPQYTPWQNKTISVHFAIFSFMPDVCDFVINENY